MLFIYAAFELIRILFQELFGLKRSYTVDLKETPELKVMKDQLKTIQKDLRDVGKILITQETEKKNGMIASASVTTNQKLQSEE
jgi:cob(I)alamin adenosyltransferase